MTDIVFYDIFFMVMDVEDNNINVDVAKRIHSVIKEQHFTQKDFAKEINFSSAQLSRVINCKNEPSETLLTGICYKFGIGLEWLKTGEGNKYAIDDCSQINYALNLFKQLDNSLKDFNIKMLEELIKMNKQL